MPDPQAEVHAIIISIPQASLVEYLTARRCLPELPPDATVAAAWIERQFVDGAEQPCHLVLRLEHPSFPLIPAGSRVPRVKTRFRRLSEHEQAQT